MAGRGNGEGTVVKRTDGRYVAALSLPGGRRKYLYGKTRREAADKLTQALAARDRGLPSLDDRVTVGTFLTRWLEDCVRPRVRPGTAESYEMHIRIHLKPAIGRVRLTSLTPDDVQRLLNAKSAAGLSPATVHRIRATLRSALNQAMKWNMISRNVATLVDPPRTVHHDVEPLTPQEARLLLDATMGDRLGPLYCVGLSLGLRMGEILGLSWSAVDLESGTLTVRQALQRVSGKPTLVEPKSSRSRRTLPLPTVVVARLREQRATQNRERLLAGDRWQDTGLVFTTSLGTPMDGPNVTHQFQRALAAAGLPRKRFHDLRHSCASFLLAQGLSMRAVMEQLGQSQVGLTMNTYAHIAPAMLRKAADAMDALLTDNV